MPGTTTGRIVLSLLACALVSFGPEASAGRRKAPAAPPPAAAIPDPSPGSVQERGYAEDAEGAIMDRLGFVVRMYAYGMRRYITDAASAADAASAQATSEATHRPPGDDVPVSPASVEVFARQLRVATFAFFEYTWVEDGHARVRAFVSRSNRGLDRFILRTSTDLRVPGQTEATYLQDSDAIHFVRDSEPVAGSSVRPVHTGASNRANDAEITILQHLSQEIQANPAMRGGSLVAYVSQQPCESCSPALRHFARENDATVRVNYVYGQRGEGRETTLYRALRQVREVSAALLTSYFATRGTARPE